MPTGSKHEATWTVSELSSLLDMSRHRVQELTQLGVLMRASAGRYDMRVSVKNYIRWLRDRALRRAGNDDGGETSKGRKTKAEAEMAEIELAEMKGQLIKAEGVEASWNKVASAIRTRMLALPSTLTPVLMPYMRDKVQPADVQAKIGEIVDNVLIALSQTEVEDEEEQDQGEGADNGEDSEELLP